MKRLNVPNCTGCAACSNICPQDAIDMREDAEGFEYPYIQEDRCTDCGLCEEICPVLSKDRLPKFRKIPDVYAAWHSDQEIRMQSSSGGVFSALASRVLDQGGVVFGAAFDEEFLAYHKAIDSKENLDELRRSKYVQSRIGYTFREVKHHLSEGKPVLFVGTPCQTAGLYAYLGRDFENLKTCALVCKGAPSRKVFRRYLRFLEEQYGSKIVSYSFRDKRAGWACNEAFNLANGEEVVGREQTRTLPSYFYAFAQKSLLARTSCYGCPFKGLPGYADIILGDFWSIRWRKPEWDDNKGTSLVLVNSDKGEKLVGDAQEYLTIKACPFDYVRHDGGLMRSGHSPRSRARLFADLDRIPFDKLARKYMTQPNAAVKFIKKIERSLKWCVKKVLGWV